VPLPVMVAPEAMPPDETVSEPPLETMLPLAVPPEDPINI
jgi:hypothetical protein